MITSILFDLDNTLVRTLPGYRYHTVGRTLHELGITAPLHLIDRFWFGPQRNRTIQEEFGVSPDTFWKYFRTYDTTTLRQTCTHPYHDADILTQLKQQGYQLGIVTSAPADIATLEINMLGRTLFDSIIIAQAQFGMQPKPHPQGIYACLTELHTPPDQAVFVGNADEDVEAAQQAHVLDVLVDRKDQTIISAPTHIIHNLHELQTILQG